jgi:putative PIN family toxin of toxin-antitoxin system
VRAVLDPNVLIAAVLSPGGSPAQLVARWLAGEFELIASQQLLDELERALAYPKLRRHISSSDADTFASFLAERAFVVEQPQTGSHHSTDPGDDYLLALAEHRSAVLVSGDQHLLALAPQLPILTPRQFLEQLEARTP